jgi:hypothetical protein
MASLKSWKDQLSAGAKAWANSVVGLAFVIVGLVAIYGDVMFISLMWSAFPDGFLKVLGIAGAIVTSMSIIGLMIGKTTWFRPGGQLNWAWFFTAIEWVVSLMNAIVATFIAWQVPLGYLDYWRYIVPGTPFVAAIGWTLLIYFSQDRQQLHKRMEMDDRMQAAELEYELGLKEAALEAKMQALEIQKNYLLQALQSTDSQRRLQQGASQLNESILSKLTGIHIPLTSIDADNEDHSFPTTNGNIKNVRRPGA